MQDTTIEGLQYVVVAGNGPPAVMEMVSATLSVTHKKRI